MDGSSKNTYRLERQQSATSSSTFHRVMMQLGIRKSMDMIVQVIITQSIEAYDPSFNSYMSKHQYWVIHFIDIL